MGSIESLSPVKAGGLALLVCGLNPKNLMLSAGAGISLAQAGSSDGEAAVGLIMFVLIGVSGVATPVIYSLTGGERAADVLDGWKAWLSTHNDAVMAVLFLVFGAVLFSQGLRGLTA
jgi:threonine/homoserine/homoserine lactone efflux protein